MVAYFLATKVLKGQRLWRSALAVLLTGAIASCTVSAFSDTWWCKDLSYSNPEVVRRINATHYQLVISEIGQDFTNTGDLISLSYLLHQDVRLLLLSGPFNVETLNVLFLLPGNSEPLVFRPSKKLSQTLERPCRLELVFAAGRLWRLVSFNRKSYSLPK